MADKILQLRKRHFQAPKSSTRQRSDFGPEMMNLKQKLNELWNRKSKPQDIRSDRRRRLSLERMEDRRLMAVIDLATLTAQQGTAITTPSNTYSTGRVVSSAGDINGDGYDDLMIAANTMEYQGRMFVVFGRDNMSSIIDLDNLGTDGISFIGQTNYHGIGLSLSAAGDINGDGFDDLILGARNGLARYQNNNDKGESYLIFGASTLPTSINLGALGSNGVIFRSTTVFDAAGRVSAAGDVNGDGFDDLIIGAPSYGVSRVYFKRGGHIIYGRAQFPTVVSVLDSDVIIERESDAFADLTGFSVSSAGDVNGDGFDDLILGAPRNGAAGNLKTYAGSTFLIFGGSALPATIKLATLGSLGVKIFGADAGDESGRSVSNVGDVNGDGYDDLIIGAPKADAANNAKLEAGESYLIFGRAIFPATIDLKNLGSAGMTIFGADANDSSGFSVSGAGDINADGFDDLFIGASGADGLGNNKPSAGESYVIFGKAVLASSMNLAQLAADGIKIIGANSNDRSGQSVSDAGDVNGDGFADLIIGAPGVRPQSNYDFRTGASYVIFGGNGFTSSVNRIGTSAQETLTGTSAADNMVGGRGDDILIGNGGADVLLGGQGNDVLAFSSLDFRRIDGGTGSDTLRFDGADLGLKLNDPRLGVFETVDITGTGNNLLVVKKPDVLRAQNDTLIVRGNAGDRINYGTGWAQAANQVINGVSYYVFTQGTATLKVQVGVTVNRAPVIAGFVGQVTARQNGPAVIVDSDATIADVDSPNFAGGSLTVSIIANSEVADRLEIRNTGNAAGQIGVSGNTIRYGNKIIGTFAGTTTLVVTLNGNATPQGAQALLRNITFRTSAISTATRTVQVTLNDGDGVISNLPTKTVRVIASNVAPVLANFGANVAYDATFDSTLTVSTSATVADPDSNFHRGTLTFSIENGQAEDYFRAPVGAVIESVSGGQGLTPLVVTFNDSTNSTAAAVQAILRGVVWGTDSRIEGPRTIRVTLADGDGGTSNSLSKTINVTRTKIAPVVSGVTTPVSYYIVNRIVPLAPNAVLATGRLSVFTNGNLTISTPQGGTATDQVNIIHDGMYGIAIGVIGADVFYGGLNIGTFTGGVGGTPLVVTFNSNATKEAVQRLLRRVAFSTPDVSPFRSSRTFSVDLMVEGLPSTPQTISMQISYAPEILRMGESVNYSVGTQPIRVAASAQVSGLDTRRFTGGSLSFTVTQNGEATDEFSIITETSGSNRIAVNGGNLTAGGVVFGTFSGGTGLSPLVITFNANADARLVTRLINLVAWRSTVQSPSLNPRTFVVSLVDREGLQSLPVTKQITLS